jgi:hypothetical protein
MASLTEIVSEFIEELRKKQNSTKPPIDKDDPFPLPRMIGTGDGNGIIISRKVDELITTVSRQIWSNDPSLAQRVTDAEWSAAVRGAFGPALIKIDLDDDLQQNARAVLDDVVATVNRGTTSYGTREYGLGCTLFSENTKISSFAIGPVRFEPRIDWLERKISDGAFPAVTARRLKRALRGQKLSKRKASFESLREKDVLDVVGRCPYVCSISTNGFAAESGQEKALLPRGLR